MQLSHGVRVVGYVNDGASDRRLADKDVDAESGGIHRPVVAADGAEHWPCSGGAHATEAHLRAHSVQCAAPRARQLPVRVLALLGATKRGGKQSRWAEERRALVVSGV
ncbi:hypothetical protein TRVL_08462 [Trypanosoma vivax]|nr:hypothetical protein TRVL_08462 [Trypanosoma vivax]